MEQYEKGKLIGSGSASSVYEATDRKTGGTVALKYRNFHDLDSANSLMESYLHSKISHPNIVDCKKSVFTASHMIYVLEYAETDLRKYLNSQITKMRASTEKKWQLNTSTIKNCIRSIATAIGYLHTMDVVHCDVKPENILCSAEGENPQLCDFSSVKVGNLHDTPGCTSWYRAPEGYNNDYGTYSDVWSLGCVFFELLTGYVLHHNLSETERKQGFNIETKICNMFPCLLGNWDAIDLLSQMLCSSPSNRISIELILKHKYLA